MMGMLKKITTSQLRRGMYIQELCGAWIDSPFWQKSFLLADDAAIAKLLATPIREAWIDTDKGLDVEEARAEEGGKAPALAPVAPSVEVSKKALSAIVPVSMQDEIGRAGKIVATSKQAVFSMFQEARMGNAINTEHAMPLVEEIAASVMRNPGALIGLARLKTADDYTYMHSVAVCALMISLSRQLGLDDDATRQAGLAGLLHDIGKMAVPPEILNKPGKLTDDEFVSVREHPAAGLRMLEDAVGISDIVRDVCIHHHEKLDGSGYPHRLQGDAISRYARMGAVCDVYDAITSNRPYKQGWCPAESLRRMAEWTPNHLDPVVFQAFVKSIGIYPVGTLVRLESGRLGVVVEQQPGKSLLLPKVRVFFSTKSMVYIAPLLLDLSATGQRDPIITREDATKWGLRDIDRFWIGDKAG
jgi:putative nucleotidyltransferase with HDIG domain